MRKIKFRAWDKKYLVMDYDFSKDLLITRDGKILEKDERNFADQYWVEYDEVDHYVLMQFTGLKDKNGKEIYEGDIIVGDPDIPCAVSWIENDACFIALSENKRICISPYRFNEREIIGNIYANPELLEKTNG